MSGSFVNLDLLKSEWEMDCIYIALYNEYLSFTHTHTPMQGVHSDAQQSAPRGHLGVRVTLIDPLTAVRSLLPPELKSPHRE